MPNAVSNNHFSHDLQVLDTVNSLDEAARASFDSEFPVDAEYMSWVTDPLEANTGIYWEEGEPWLPTK